MITLVGFLEGNGPGIVVVLSWLGSCELRITSACRGLHLSATSSYWTLLLAVGLALLSSSRLMSK